MSLLTRLYKEMQYFSFSLALIPSPIAICLHMYIASRTEVALHPNHMCINNLAWKRPWKVIWLGAHSKQD